jgi:CheY-like chemotaxis protein
VGEVADGLKVVRVVQHLKPRVLIMALAMPGLNSFEVTLRLRQRRQEPRSFCSRHSDGDLGGQRRTDSRFLPAKYPYVAIRMDGPPLATYKTS